jgi:hypothetical protein
VAYLAKIALFGLPEYFDLSVLDEKLQGVLDFEDCLLD